MAGKQGGLIQLDLNEFSHFYEQLKGAWAHCCLASATLNIWADKTGKGLLSPLAASSLKAVIKSAMDGEMSFPGSSWVPPSAEQDAFKQEHSRFQTPWKMTGSVYKNLVDTKRDGVWIVGIDRRATVPQTGFRTYAKHPRTKGNKMKVETYAAMNEYGHKNTPARPIFVPAALYFITNRFPKLYDLVEKTFSVVAKNRMVDQYQGKSKVKADFSDTISQNTVDASKGMDPENDFNYEEHQAGEVAAALKNGNINIENKNLVRNQIKVETQKFLSENKIDLSGLKDEAAEEIMRILNGKW